MMLACKHCRHRMPEDVTMGVAAAHFEIEHDTTEVEFELVVVCRCEREMPYVGSEGGRDLFWCEPCKRGKAIRREGD